MAWVLNRAGSQQQEGPYEDHQIIALIQSGDVQAGYIAESGSTNWSSLGEYAPFAEALQGIFVASQPPPESSLRCSERSSLPASGATMSTRRQSHPAVTVESRAGRSGLIIAALGGLLLLLGAGLAAMMAFGSGESRLSAFVPERTSVFVEVPSNRQVLAGLLGVDFVEPKQVNSETYLEDLVRDVGTAFELKRGEARAFLLSAEGAAFAMGQVPPREEGPAVLVSFRVPSAVEPLLSSARFTRSGEFGESGERYRVAEGKGERGAGLAGLLTQLNTESRKRDALVWFEEAGFLAWGDERFLEDIDRVVTSGEHSLGESEEFIRARFSSESAAIAYFSPYLPDTLKGVEVRQLVRDYMDGIDPLAVEMEFVDAGVLFTARGYLRGRRITPDDQLPGAGALDIQQRLPRGTIAYAAFGTRRGADGKGLKKRVFQHIRTTNEDLVSQLELGVALLERQSGLPIEELIDALGEQVVVGIVAAPELSLAANLKPERYVQTTAALLLIEVGEEKAAERIVSKARRRLFSDGPLREVYEVTDQGAGYRGTPKDPDFPTISVRFYSDVLAIGVGGKAVLAQAMRALRGRDSLSTDVAHETAIGALEGTPRMLLWVDTGRIASAALDGASDSARRQIGELEEQFGVSHRAIRLNGEQRVTAAIAGYASSDAESWAYELKFLNPSSLGIFGGLRPLLHAQSEVLDRHFAALTPFAPKSGVPQCDAFALVMSQCAQKTNDQSFAFRARMVERVTNIALRKNGTAGRKALLGNDCIRDLLAFQRGNKQCF